MTNPELTFGKMQRVKSGDDFRRCYQLGQRAGDSHLLVFAVLNDVDHSRLGVSVSKKHGNAVARNRKKRLLREAFRLVQNDLPKGLDLVLVPRQRKDSSLDQYQKSLLRLVRKLQRRLSTDESR